MVERTTQGLAKAAVIVSVAMALSRVLGFFRNSAISLVFGQNRLTDMLNASFIVPDTIYLILVGGGISSAFVPVLSGYLAEKKDANVWRTASIAFNLVLVAVGAAVAICMLLAPLLVRVVAPGFTPHEVAYTAYLTRIVLMAILFHCLNGVLMGTEYAYQSFIGTSLGPLVYNAAIIIFGLILAKTCGIAAFAYSTLIGAALNFLVQLWGVWRLKPVYTFSLDLRDPGILRTVKLMLPVSVGLSIAQINLFINQTFIASFLPSGSINALTISSRVVLVPILFSASMGITLLPALTRRAREKDMKTFAHYLTTSLRAIIFIALPGTVGLIVLAEPIIRILFEHGRFTPADTLVTAQALTYYSLGIIAYGTYEILSRAFYALEDTITPLKISLVTLAVGTSLNFTLGPLWGVRGLALAYSLAGFVNICLLYRALARRVQGLDMKRIGQTFTKSLVASLFMGALIFLLAPHFILPVNWIALIREAIELVSLILLGALFYLALAYLLRMEEYTALFNFLGRRLQRVAVRRQN
ncbi:MAG: putative peptidoglycan lipid flippase [Clostridia bacterium]|nr:putative peptidoglycan lipid flippase [Clostridia bacterium]